MTPLRFSLLAAASLGVAAAAQVPTELSYHGRLLKTDGTPESGTVSMTFAIFAEPSGGVALWSETQDLTLTDGFYSTHLGRRPFTPGLFDGADRYLELSVNGKTLSPRQRIASNAYALRATDARNVVGGDVNASGVSIAGTSVISGAGQLVGPAAAVFSTPGTLNAAGNPVDWTKLKGVPAGFADGTDDGVSPQAGAGIAVNGATVSLTPCPAGTVLRSTGSGWSCSAGLTTESDPTVNALGKATLGCNPGQLVKWSGTDWVCAVDVDTNTVATGGDLAGAQTGATVIGLQGRPVTSTAPVAGQLLEWVGTAWAPSTRTESDPSVNALGKATLSCGSGQLPKWSGTGWTCATDTDTVTTGGDLSGAQTAATVVGLQGRGVSPAAPSPGQVLEWSGAAWAPATRAESDPSVNALGKAALSCGPGQLPKWTGMSWTCAGDLDTDTVATGGDLSGAQTAATVVGLQGRAVSGAAPSPGQVLEWSGAAWAPATRTESDPTVNALGKASLGCAPGELAKWSGASWACAADNDANTVATGGDLSGNQTAATVTGLRGRAVSVAAPAPGQVLKWNGAEWAPAAENAAVPSGMIGFFAGACPPTWAEYTPLRGRVIVGLPAGGTSETTVGTALGNGASRTITDVPAHAHSVDPPATASGGQSSDHSHGGSTSNAGSHSHTVNAQNLNHPSSTLWTNSSTNAYGFQTQWGGVGGLMSAAGDHSHSFTTSGVSADHQHTTDIAAFGSGSTGLPAVDVTMPYIQLIACRAP